MATDPSRGDDVLDGDGGVPAGGGVVERLEGEVVGRAQVAVADLEDRVEGALVERDAGGAGDRAAVRDVVREFVAREQPELSVSVMDDPAGHGLLLVAREQRAERRLASDDEREHEPAPGAVEDETAHIKTLIPRLRVTLAQRSTCQREMARLLDDCPDASPPANYLRT